MTAASNPAAELTEAELRDAARDAWQMFLLLPNTPSPLGDRMQRHHTALSRMADRLARLAAGGAVTDVGLRARVEALCQGWESWGAGVTQECAAMLRDVLDAAPAPIEDATTERRLVRRGKCTCGEVTPENHWGHADGCRYFADSVYEDVPASRATDVAAEEPRTEAQTLLRFVESDAVQYALTVAEAGHRGEAEARLRDAAEQMGRRYEEAEGCDCTELCSMGPTCPGGMLARLPGSGCSRMARTEAQIKAEALREAADYPALPFADPHGAIRRWLRDRADRLSRADEEAGNE